jgi:hypothetical protein
MLCCAVITGDTNFQPSLSIGRQHVCAEREAIAFYGLTAFANTDDVS